MSLSNINIETIGLPINRLNVKFLKPPAECKSRSETDSYTQIQIPDGREFWVTDRFWNSFSSLMNMGRSVFDLFSHAEVFDRIHTRNDTMVRVTMEVNPDTNSTAQGRLLSMTNPKKPILQIDQVASIIDKYEGQNIAYDKGVITSQFDCPFDTPYNISGEEYSTRFATQMPIDGYGLPCSYLVMLRLICQNGVVGHTKAFKTAFQLGKGDDSLYSVLDRAMETFTAEEGFHDFSKRLESAAKSWASLHETNSAYKAISKSMTEEGYNLKARLEILNALDALCGNPLKTYGLGNTEEISARRAATIPVNATVYQLITFMSEISTHKLNKPHTADRINAWVGNRISNEYDMEGTVDELPELDAFFLTEPQTAVGNN